MSDDLIYEELREAITQDLNDLKLIFANNGIAVDTYKKLFKEGGLGENPRTKECIFFENHLMDRINKNIKNLQNYLKENE
jgi:cobalamin biosynthesis Co2+ chelatase CbiK